MIFFLDLIFLDDASAQQFLLFFQKHFSLQLLILLARKFCELLFFFFFDYAMRKIREEKVIHLRGGLYGGHARGRDSIVVHHRGAT